MKAISLRASRTTYRNNFQKGKYLLWFIMYRKMNKINIVVHANCKKNVFLALIATKSLQLEIIYLEVTLRFERRLLEC